MKTTLELPDDLFRWTDGSASPCEIRNISSKGFDEFVVEEGHITNPLVELKKVYDTLMFEEQKELVALLIREIPVSRFAPDNVDSSADPDVFKVKMRPNLKPCL